MSAWTFAQRAAPVAVIAGIALVASNLPASTNVPPAPTAAAVSAPTLEPDRITLNPTADNATTARVSWRGLPGIDAQAQISPDTSNPWGFVTTSVKGTATTSHVTDLGYQQSFYEASFTGLKPGATYLYRVGDGTTWSAWMPLTTSNPDTAKTSLLAFGDIQRGIKDHWTRVAYAAAQDRPRAKALITVGDQINRFDNDGEWDQLFDAAGLAPRQMPWIAAVGNHEYRSTDSGELTPQYRGQFRPPAGPTDFAQFEGTVYSTDIDNVRVVTLNSYYRIPKEKADEQRWLDALAAYLEKVLADNPREFTIVNMHYPIYSSSPDRGNPELRATLEPVFEKYGVDLVLQGHDQAYVSGQRDASPSPNESGPLYVTSSSAARHYPLDYSDWIENGAQVMTAFTSRSTYQVIDVDDRTMTYTAKDSTGAVLDQWRISHVGRDSKVRHLTGIGVAK